MDNAIKNSKPNSFANMKTNVMKIYIAHLFVLSYHTIKFERVCLKKFLFLFFPFEKIKEYLVSHVGYYIKNYTTFEVRRVRQNCLYWRLDEVSMDVH